ncbi:hypothetical protein [Polynucleobacter sp. AP-Latsch-80-C2]|jgi:hypothetical protein|uniref:hypothetical protein n=1 Tax=Polynucleobacter sp. AP-Latsch-80-C2 TaxID=2576931 RepID=UPI001C0AC563|nr:hypothetical protein [Polynucleobacter sp. AP-Latsch-80-C2]MBU3624266.1 hypothetical protein [Polynucleobacter sp. AP-Latsch-80-C2]
MNKILFVIALLVSSFNAFAYEPSECDGISKWERGSQNSADVLTRSCNIFGMNFIEIKSKLNENRCIVVMNSKTGDQWKHFYLRKQSIKALGNAYFDPTVLVITSKNAENNRCFS